MAELVVDQDSLTVSLSALEKLGSLRRSDLTIPSAHIVDVERVERGRSHIRGNRMPGSQIPGKVLLGTFIKKGIRTFAAAYGQDSAYVITLENEHFDRLVISGPQSHAVEGLGRNPHDED